MPAKPSRQAAMESAAFRQNGLFRRTIDTRQTSESPASAAATGSQIREAAARASATSAGQNLRKNESIAVGLAFTGSGGKDQCKELAEESGKHKAHPRP